MCAIVAKASTRLSFLKFLGRCTVCAAGFLVGYISHRKPQVEPVNCDETKDTGETEVAGMSDELQLNWNSITQLLTQKLTSQNFEKTLR